MTKKILVLGEPLQETDKAGNISISGDAVNFAAGTILMQPCIRELLDSEKKIEIGLIGTLGDSESAKRVEALLDEKGIKRDLVKTVVGGTLGEYEIKPDLQGGKGFHFKNREYAAFRKWFKPEYAEARAEALQKIDKDTTLVLSGITVSRAENQEDFEELYHFVRSARDQGARIVFDTNNREKLWKDRIPHDVPEGLSADASDLGPRIAANRMGAMMGLATVLYVTAPDDTKLWYNDSPESTLNNLKPDYFAQSLLKSNPHLQQVIVKKGEEGATLYARPQSTMLKENHLNYTGSHVLKIAENRLKRDSLIVQHIPIKPATNFLDSGGAGDNFMAGTETALALTPDIDMNHISIAQMKKAMSVGTCGASNVVQQHGCVLRKAPTVKELMEHHATLPGPEIVHLMTEKRAR